MKKIVICFVLLLLLQPITYNSSSLSGLRAEGPQPIYAADSTQSALKTLREELASRAADPIIKSEVAKKLQNKAYLGTVKDKNSNVLTLSVHESSKTININKFTEYVIKSKTYTGDDGLKNIAVDNTVAALGDIDDKGVLTAKRIIKLSAPLPPQKKIIHGIVTSISPGKTTLKNIQGGQFSISFDKKTDFQMGKSDGSFDDIKSNVWLIVVGEPVTGGETINAKFVYIFPYAITVKPKPTTSSATPTKKPI